MSAKQNSGLGQPLGTKTDFRPVVVEVNAVSDRLQTFKHLHPVTWASLLLVAGKIPDGVDEAEAVRRALISIGEASERNRRNGEGQKPTASRNLTGVRDLLKGLSKPHDWCSDHVVIQGLKPNDQEFFSRVFKTVSLWQNGGRAFGLALDKKQGVLILVDHDELRNSRENAPLVAVEVKPAASASKMTMTNGHAVQSRDAMAHQHEPRLGQLETLDSYRDVIKGGVRLKGWRDEEIDAPIRNQMLYIDRETSGLPDVLSDDPSVRDEPLMTLVKRMSQWSQCLRFLHCNGTLIGYVSGAPLRDERTLKSRDPIRHDLNLLREDVWWGSGESGDDNFRPKAFYFSSIRLLDRDHDQRDANRMKLMDGVESILLALAEVENMYFQRLYVCIHQPHVRQACMAMIDRSKHAKQEDAAEKQGYPKLNADDKRRAPRRVHLAPEWCVADGHLEKLKAVYRQAGFIK